MTIKLISKKIEASDVISFLFEPEQELTWKAGQYLRYTLNINNPDERGLKRYFTISSPPFQKQIQLTTRFSVPSSSFKTTLNQLASGTAIEVSKPLGDFIIEDPKQQYVFIAGGIGITPFHSILLDLEHKKLPINVTLLYANRNEEIIFKNELDAISSKQSNFKIKYFIGKHRITELDVRQLSSIFKLPYFYISGPEQMMISFVNMLSKIGIPKEYIKHDFFSGYSVI